MSCLNLQQHSRPLQYDTELCDRFVVFFQPGGVTLVQPFLPPVGEVTGRLAARPIYILHQRNRQLALQYKSVATDSFLLPCTEYTKGLIRNVTYVSSTRSDNAAPFLRCSEVTR